MSRALPALILGLVLLVASSAHAAWLPHHDLASLVFASDEVVLGKRTLADAGSASSFEVQKVYKGQLAVGQSITTVVHASGQDPAKVSELAVLFMKREKDGSLALVASGMRILLDDRVQRFVSGGRFGDH
jgi:hypothetical protein